MNHRIDKKQLEILYLEDSPLDADLVYEYLCKNAMYEINMKVVIKEEEFVAAISSQTYDLILADFSLPGFDGFVALAHVKAICPSTPFICVSGFIGEETAVELLKQGATDYVSKDKLGRLIYSIERALKATEEEESLRKAQISLVESEERFRATFEQAAIGIFHATIDGEFTRVNQKLCDITDYSQDELLNMSLVDITHPNELENDLRNMTRLLKGDINEFCVEKSYFKKDGTIVWVNLTVSMINQLAGEFIYFMGMMEDISERKLSIEKMKRILMQAVTSLSNALSVRDPYTAGHQRRVVVLAVAIAEEMDLSEDQIKGIMVAGNLHDIGKIIVPSEILNKPGKLSDLEFGLIKNHPQAGYEIVKDIEFPWPVAEVLLQHHERMNGSGYPLGLAGEGILLEARIMAVADVVEAMSSHRPYRPALGIDSALAEISQNRGILFDPEAVDACLKLFKEQGFEME